MNPLKSQATFMFQYFQTTTMILFWAVLISVLWSGIVYFLPFKPNNARKPKAGQFILPTLLFAPMLIVIFYDVMDVNLIFPVALTASTKTIFFASIVPAAVLCVATGLLYNIASQINSLKARFFESNFSKLTVALGLSPKKRLLKLIVSKALLDSWVGALPWVFGELIIVEALFNAHGLGLDLWHMARMRDMVGFAEGVIWLLGIYTVIALITSSLSRGLGRKLEGYS
jgi:ABC-type dipeptide/oligopeptide/nickel transport system permease component